MSVQQGIVAGKLNALEVFTYHLLRSTARDCIAKVIVFGSVKSGLARPESDIDVMVVTTGPTQPIARVARRVAERVFNSTGEWVEVHAHPIGAWLQPQSLFLLGARQGKEVYTMDDAAIRRSEAQKYIGLSLTYRETAEHLLKSGQTRVAADAAHNAIELALKAMLLLTGVSLPRSHREVITRFLLEYRKLKRLPAGMTRQLHQALDTRNRARYDPDAAITKAETKAMLRLGDKVLELLQDSLDATAATHAAPRSDKA